jgi:type IV secretory pathway protease TraF
VRAAVCALGAAAITALIAPDHRPSLIWNATASAPEGLYRLQPHAPIRVGDWLAVRPPPPLAWWLAARHYLPGGALLIKRAAALAPSIVCRQADVVTVDGRQSAIAAVRDRWGRELPVWSGCRRLTGAEIFLVNPTPGSLDGRYLGPLPRTSVVGLVHPLWLVGGATDAG